MIIILYAAAGMRNASMCSAALRGITFATHLKWEAALRTHPGKSYECLHSVRPEIDYENKNLTI